MAAGGAFPDELIIREVRKHSCLYDPRQADYKDADRKASVWRQIANQLGMSAIECEHRWRYLRDRYTRERKRKSQQTVNGTPYKVGNWPLARQMHFIQDFIKHRRARGPGGTTSQEAAALRKAGADVNSNDDHRQVKVEGEASSSEESANDDCQSSIDPSEYPMVIIEEHVPGHAPAPPGRPGLAVSPDRRSSCEHRNERSRSPAPAPAPPSALRTWYTEDELFCLSLAQTLKRFPPQQRSLTKVKILQLMHETEFAQS